MTTDCSLNYKFNTWKFQAQTWGEHVVYRNCFWYSEQFLYRTCSPHALQREELLTKVYLYLVYLLCAKNFKTTLYHVWLYAGVVITVWISKKYSEITMYIFSFSYVSAEITKQLPNIMPDFMLVFAITVLAHHPEFESTQDVDFLKRIRDALWWAIDFFSNKVHIFWEGYTIFKKIIHFWLDGLEFLFQLDIKVWIL